MDIAGFSVDLAWILWISRDLAWISLDHAWMSQRRVGDVPHSEVSGFCGVALLCTAGSVHTCGCGAKRREGLLGDSDHLFCAGSGGRLGCGGTFSFLILVAGGQIDVGVHVDLHVDRLGRGYVAGLRRWGK